MRFLVLEYIKTAKDEICESYTAVRRSICLPDDGSRVQEFQSYFLSNSTTTTYSQWVSQLFLLRISDSMDEPVKALCNVIPNTSWEPTLCLHSSIRDEHITEKTLQSQVHSVLYNSLVVPPKVAAKDTSVSLFFSFVSVRLECSTPSGMSWQGYRH